MYISVTGENPNPSDPEKERERSREDEDSFYTDPDLLPEIIYPDYPSNEKGDGMGRPGG